MIKILRHSDPKEKKQIFFLIGELLVSKEVKKELALTPSSDDSFIWFISMEGKQVRGFAALQINKNKNAWLKHQYVLPEFRGTHISTSLLNARMSYLSNTGIKRVRVVIKPERKAQYEKLGFFEEIKRGKQYIVMLKQLEESGGTDSA